MLCNVLVEMLLEFDSLSLSLSRGHDIIIIVVVNDEYCNLLWQSYMLYTSCDDVEQL
jgi:hypothetical protein